MSPGINSLGAGIHGEAGSDGLANATLRLGDDFGWPAMEEVLAAKSERDLSALRITIRLVFRFRSCAGIVLAPPNCIVIDAFQGAQLATQLNGLSRQHL